MKQRRNEPSCGSGKKFKKCCLLAKWEAAREADIQLIERIRQKGIDDTLKAQAEARSKAEAMQRRGRIGAGRVPFIVIGGLAMESYGPNVHTLNLCPPLDLYILTEASASNG